MLRLYTDLGTPRPLDTIDVELWESSSGNPGQSMITPFAVWPDATPEDPQAWSYVDFRGMSINIEDDFFWGYTYRSQWPVILGDDPAMTDRSKAYLGGAWAAAGTDYHIRVVVDYGMVGVNEDGEVVPAEFALRQNYPNPFNAKTTITYSLAECSDITLEVFNIMGQKIATLENGNKEAGIYTVTWDASDVSSGVYFYKLSIGNNVFTRKMSLLK